jgi:hypothetical protein
MGDILTPFTRMIAMIFIVGLTAPLAAQTLPPPSAFTAAPGDGAVSLNWAPQPSATAYHLYRDLLDSPTPTPTGTLTPGVPATPTPITTVSALATPAFVDGQVTNGRNYQYRLFGVNALGEGASAAATALPFSPPAIIQSVQVANNFSDALNISWGIPLSTYPVTLYQIYRVVVPIATVTGTPSPIPGSVVLTVNPTPYALAVTNEYTDAAVGTPGASYFFYLVLAQDSDTPPNVSGVPAFSSSAGQPQTLAPAAPDLSAFSEATLTPVTYGVRLLWGGPAASEGVTGYQVMRNNSAITILPVTTPTPTYGFNDTTAPFSSSAFFPLSYSVSAMSPDGNTGSNTVPVTFFGPVVSSPITVTPDATVNAVTITWGQGSNGSYGLQGYRVYKSLNGSPVLTAPPTATGTLTVTLVPTTTPTPFSIVLETPSVTPTLQVVDSPVANANGISYWVEPFDTTGHAGTFGVPTPGALALAPTPVSAIQAANPTGNNEVALNWSGASAGFYGPIQGYALYREPVSTFQTVTPTPFATVSAGQSTFNDFIANATPGTSYVYQIGAQDLKGNLSDLSSVSNQVTAITAQAVPSSPTLSPLTGDGNSLTYSWLLNPLADGVTQYTVYGPDFPTMTITPTPVAIDLPTPGPYSLTRPTAPWQASLFYLLAKNAQGFSAPATLAGVNIPAYQVTALMTPGSRQMQVYWNATPTITPTPGFAAVDAYGVYRSLTPGVNFTPIATVSITTPVFIDTALTPGLFYYYRITARSDVNGQLAAESPLYPTMTPIPEGKSLTWPNVPQGFAATGGVTQTTLSWFPNAASDQVTSYAVFLNGSPTPIATFIGTPVPQPNGTTTPTPALVWQATETPGSISSYQIEALNSQGPSDQTQTSQVLSAPAFTPTIAFTPPAGFSPTPGATPAVPQLVWISGLDYTGAVDGYNIYSSTDANFDFENLVGSVASPTSVLSDPAIQTQGFITYYRAVASSSAFGIQANQNTVGSTAVTLWPNPPAALNLSANTTAVTLAWATPVGNVPVTGYQIYRATFAGATPTPYIGPIPAASSVTVDGRVTPVFEYFYSMISSNANGQSSPITQGIIAIQPPALQVTPLAGHNQLVWAEFSPTVTPSPGVVSGFAVYRAIPTPGATPTFVEITQVSGAAATAYSDTAVSDSVAYLYQVAAVSSDGVQSGLSASVSQLVVPQPVSGLTPISGDGLVQLRWTFQGAPSNTVTYTLLRKLGTDSNPFQVVKTGITGNNFTDTGLLDKTFYVYELETIDTLSQATTLSAAVTALPAKPPIINDGAVTVSQSGNANTLSWYPADLAVPFTNPPVTVFDPTSMYPLGGYVIFQSQDGGATYPVSFTSGIGQPSAGSVTYVDPENIVGGLAFTYLVQAFDDPPDAPVSLAHSSSYNIVTAFPLGASTALDLNAIRPNDPTGNAKVVNLRLAVTAPGMVTIKVYNLAGTFIKQLFHQSMNVGVYYKNTSFPGLQWDGKNMNGSLVASGVYLITTDMSGHQEIDKVALIK